MPYDRLYPNDAKDRSGLRRFLPSQIIVWDAPKPYKGQDTMNKKMKLEILRDGLSEGKPEVCGDSPKRIQDARKKSQ